MFRFFSRLVTKILGKAQDVPAEAFSTAVGFAVSSAITAPMQPLNEILNQKFPYSKLSVSELQQLLNRGEIDENTFADELKKMGFSDERIKQLLILASYMPSIPDVVRFAVREAFDDKTAEKYGLDVGYPEKLTEYGVAQGARKEDLKYYWRSHWELPSLTAGYQMYHRDIISYDDLKLLLKSQDVMPYWADKLIQLSETPFTRVDVRRMYQLGVLSFDEMVRAYKDLGYSKDKATKLARFTQVDVMDEERSLNKTEILRMYEEGVLTQDDAYNFLKNMGYPDEYVKYLITLQDIKTAGKKFNLIKTAVKKRYLRGIIDKNDVVVLLSKWGLTSREIDTSIEAWDLEKDISKLPSKAELFKFYEAKIIDEITLRKMLEVIGYDKKYVEWYIQYLKAGEKEKEGE